LGSPGKTLLQDEWHGLLSRKRCQFKASPFVPACSLAVLQTPPYHVFFFVRLQKLFHKVITHTHPSLSPSFYTRLDSDLFLLLFLFPQAGGGIFSDLSWLHLRPISSNIFTGYHQTTHCSIPESEEDVLLPPLTSLEDPTFEDINQSFRSCYTSSLLVFRSTIHNLETKPKPNSPSAPSVQSPVPSQMILQCMLAKYDQENGALRRCLHLEPLLTGGALCVQVNSFLSASLSPLGLNSVCG
jgi:hypothetical protein